MIVRKSETRGGLGGVPRQLGLCGGLGQLGEGTEGPGLCSVQCINCVHPACVQYISVLHSGSIERCLCGGQMPSSHQGDGGDLKGGKEKWKNKS